MNQLCCPRDSVDAFECVCFSIYLNPNLTPINGFESLTLRGIGKWDNKKAHFFAALSTICHIQSPTIDNYMLHQFVLVMQVHLFAVSQIVDGMLICIYSLVWGKTITCQLNDINSDNC